MNNNKDFYDFFHDHIVNVVKEISISKNIAFTENFINFIVENPKQDSFGDISTNVAMFLSKFFNMNAMDLAEEFSYEIKNNINLNKYIHSINFIKPGFINITLNHNFWHQWLQEAFLLGNNYGKLNIGNNLKVNIEYVSANPTGPMHIGHGRGAVIGDVLANLYKFVGFDVTKEYYINDAGNQIVILGKSLYYRYLEQLGLADNAIKEDEFYPGEYLIECAKNLVSKVGDLYCKQLDQSTLNFMCDFALSAMITMIKNDLDLINIKHDIFVSEKEISTDASYNKTLQSLFKKDLIYQGVLNPPKGKIIEDFEAREQKLFKSTIFGDDVDRPLEKNDGSRTYFANDIVYHHYKINRGYNLLINIWGADHIGYIKRVDCAVNALSNNSVKLKVICTQLVNLLENGNPVKMSKRAGNFITLKEVVDMVGVDAFRFMMIIRKNDVPIDFDLLKIKEQSNDNPVFYIQYAYARICSVINNIKENFPNIDFENNLQYNLSLLSDESEIKLIKNILTFPLVLNTAVRYNDPHRLYLYLNDIAKNFHSLWNKGKENNDLRFVIKDNLLLTMTRLSLLRFLQSVIFNVFSILSINIKENM